jgi:hypothetical protein
MHARIDQLLSLRDGDPVDVQVRNHVQQCTRCLAEAARLGKTRARLQELPAFDPPADLFDEIATRAAQRPSHRYAWGLAAALMAVVVGAVALIAVRDARHGPLTAEQPKEIVGTPTYSNQTDLQQLIAQSRELDELLQYLPERPQVERVSLAATVDSIEERIQVLDWQLAYGPDAGLDQQQARRLWSERVELMDSLVKVRYAESAPLAF